MEESNWDVVMLGMGAGGLVADHIAGGLGLKVACIEADRVGGECSWTGCVPGKALLHAADECWRTRQGDRAGFAVGIGEAEVQGFCARLSFERVAVSARGEPGRVLE